MKIGKKLNSSLKINASHALYREDGKWYHSLNRFPGVLFDKNGYLLFNTENEYLNTPELQHGKRLHIKKGIASIKKYIPFPSQLTIDLPAKDYSDKNEELIRKIRAQSIIIRNNKLVSEIKSKYKFTCQICGIRLKVSKGQFYSEAHHIKPLGKPYNGPDILENMINVCPNCHVQLDLASIQLNPSLFKISNHTILQEFIEHHNKRCASIKK